MRLHNRLVKGTALNFVAMSFNQGSTLIASILVARILKRQAFGEYAMIYTTLLTAVTLSQLSMGYTASKYIAEFRTSNRERTGRILGACAIFALSIAAIGCAVFIGLAPWLAGHVLKSPSLSLPLVIGAGFLFFSAFNGYQTGALLGLEAFRSLAKAGVLSGVVSVAAVSLGAIWGGLVGAVTGLSIGALCRCALHNTWLRYEARKQGILPLFRGSIRQEKDIIYKFAVPAALSGYYSMPMIWLANSFLVRQPGGYGEMALYSAANNIRTMVLFIPLVMNSVMLSILNNEKGRGDIRRYNHIFRMNLTYIFVVTFGCAMIVGMAGRPLLMLFGRDFKDAYVLQWILLGSSILEGLSLALYQYIQSQGKLWLSFFGVCIPRDTTLAIVAFILVGKYGGIGLAAAFLISMIIGLLFHLLIVARLYRKNMPVIITGETSLMNPGRVY